MKSSDSSLPPDSLRFQPKPSKSVFMRLSPRVFIYPIVILVIFFCMSRSKTVQKEAERQEQQNQSTVIRMLDPAKPTALVPADAPVFPQLIFYADGELPFEDTVAKLHDKYHKTCTVTTIDFRKSPQLKQKFPEEKTPFAVFSKPDGTNITIREITSFEFYDLMLASQLQEKGNAAAPADK